MQECQNMSRAEDCVPLAYNPRGSLLELAFKLKRAYERVNGIDSMGRHAPVFQGIPMKSETVDRYPEERTNVPVFPLLRERNIQNQRVLPDRDSARTEYGHPSSSANTATDVATRNSAAPEEEGVKIQIKTEPSDEVEGSAVEPPERWAGSEDGVIAPTKPPWQVNMKEEVPELEDEEEEHDDDDDDDDDQEPGSGPPWGFVDHGDSPATVGPTSGAGGGGMARKYHCRSCDYQTDNKSHLTRHESGVHSLTKPYQCPLCKTEFSRSEKARAHMLKKHPEVPYDPKMTRRDQRPAAHMLPFSGYSTDDEHSPPRKAARMISGVPRPEPVGRPAFPGDVNLPLEMSVEDGNDSFPGTDDAVQWHQQAHDPQQEKPFECSQCSYRARDIWHLRRHAADVHQQLKDFKCAVCSYATSRKHRLISHMKSHGQLYCFHCNFSTTSLKEFNIHVQICSLMARNENLRCQYCDHPFSNRKFMKDHAMRQHGVTLYCCDLCMYWTENSDDYQSHHRGHTASPRSTSMLSVPEAEERQAISLWSHSPQQQQQQPPPARRKPGRPRTVNILPESEDFSPYAKDETDMLTCSFCQYKTKYRSVMSNHLHKHSDEKMDCVAPGCNFRTAWKRSMEIHMRAFHSSTEEGFERGRGEFQCPYCTDKPPFTYKKSFDKHIEKHKQEATQCPRCEETFILMTELKMHLRMEHEIGTVLLSEDESDYDDQPRAPASTSSTLT